MAKALLDVITCDWHAALPEKPKVAAQNERLLEGGGKVDLCDPCAWFFDVFYTRRSEILPMLQAEVLDAFHRSARREQPNRRAPAQLSLAQEESLAETAPVAATAPAKAADSKRKVPKRGVWKDEEVQVRCPLPHRAGSPRKYWVDIRNRTAHAKSHKKGNGDPYDGPDIAFVLQEEAVFTHFCTDHQVCAENGGYGFTSEAGLRAHINKSKDWPQATTEAKDAAAMRRQSAA
ncbi:MULTISPECIES: hypothetical protein [unclassified Streptomyces]|uniref:hypothetical protein n=1 Tax=unclassified Streptomyces TaxID=2593676 RepID=UPI002E2E885D|nr:hypothetical protein [Streptomyces sp. NBC_00285]